MHIYLLNYFSVSSMCVSFIQRDYKLLDCRDCGLSFSIPSVNFVGYALNKKTAEWMTLYMVGKLNLKNFLG